MTKNFSSMTNQNEIYTYTSPTARLGSRNKDLVPTLKVSGDQLSH